MIPQPHKALADIAIKLAMSITPEISSTYQAANAGMLSMLLLALSQDADRAIANRFADVEEVRNLFAAAAAAPGAERRDAFTASEPDGLRLTQVSAWHDRAMTLLVELHAWAELENPTLNRRIWDFLRAHAERNKLDL